MRRCTCRLILVISMGNDDWIRHHYRIACSRKIAWSDSCVEIGVWMMRWKVRECRHHRHVLCLMEDDVNDRCKHFRDETCGVWMKFHCFRHQMMVEMGARS